MPRKSSVHNVPSGREIQYNTIKVRLHPTPQQTELFEKTFGCCRYIWNQMLTDEQRFYLETGEHFIPTPAKYKTQAPFLKEVDNQALTQEYNRLSKAFRVFFKNPEGFGYPRFKRKKSGKNSFTVSNHKVWNTVYTTPEGIRLTKAGIVKATFPRRPRNGWTLKQVTVLKTRTNLYYACILYECVVKASGPVTPTPETTVGLKYSMSHFYVADNGARADPPCWLQQSQDRLTKLQQKLSRMQPGSRNYQETLQKYYKLHEHIANQRHDYIHKESRRITNAWDAVCVRNDDLADMARTVRHGNVMASGFGKFRECLRYKLAREGKQLMEIERYFPSTRICYDCGHTLSEAVDYRRRTWTCPKCGANHNREVNAARNIKSQGLAQFL